MRPASRPSAGTPRLRRPLPGLPGLPGRHTRPERNREHHQHRAHCKNREHHRKCEHQQNHRNHQRARGRARPEVSLVVKATAAAAVAWWVAQALPGHDVPYYAPLAALLGVYPTVLLSLREAARFTLGFLAGAAVGLPVALLLDPGVWGVVVVVPVALLVASRPGLAGQYLHVPFVALFLLTFGEDDPVGFAGSRLVDVLIGVVLGLLANALWPPAPREHAPVYPAWRLADRTSHLLREVAREVERQEPASPSAASRSSLAVHQAVLDLAEAEALQSESRRFNPRTRALRSRRAPHLRSATEALYGGAEQARVVAREIRRNPIHAERLCSEGFVDRLTAALRQAAGLVDQWGQTGDAPPPEQVDEALAAYRGLREAATADVSDRRAGGERLQLVETQLSALVLQLLAELVPERASRITPEQLGLRRAAPGEPSGPAAHGPAAGEPPKPSRPAGPPPAG